MAPESQIKPTDKSGNPARPQIGKSCGCCLSLDPPTGWCFDFLIGHSVTALLTRKSCTIASRRW